MKEITDLYYKCADYLRGSNEPAAKEIIELAIDVLAPVEELNDMWNRCVVHINNWEKNSIDEQCEQADEIIEELSAELGEYLA